MIARNGLARLSTHAAEFEFELDFELENESEPWWTPLSGKHVTTIYRKEEARAH
jgi:hypothetical protein